MTDLEVLGLVEETKLYKNIDWSDYYDFILKLIDNNEYDLYIARSGYPMRGNGYFECPENLEITEEYWVEQQILRYKMIYNIRNIIKKNLCKQ